jgi:hypothetical protein
MFGNGVRMIGMKIIKMPQLMEVRGQKRAKNRKKTQIPYCGAALGTTILSIAVLPVASTIVGAITASSISVFVFCV